VTMTPRGSIGNFNFWPFWLKLWDTIWIRLFQAKDGIIKVERWPSLTVGPDLFLSLYRVKAKWSVGWSVANVSKEVVPDQLWSTIDSPRAIQTSIWANTNNFSINQSHPRHLWPKLRKSKILTFFEIGQVTMTPRGSIGNFNFWPFWLKLWDTIWIRLFEAKDGIIKVERWPSWTVGPNLFLSLYRVKAIWSVGWSVANVLSQIIPDQH